MPLTKYKGGDKSPIKGYKINPNYTEVEFDDKSVRNFDDKTHGPDWRDKLNEYLKNGKFANRFIMGKMSKEDKKEAESIHEKKESSFKEWKERRMCKQEKEEC